MLSFGKNAVFCLILCLLCFFFPSTAGAEASLEGIIPLRSIEELFPGLDEVRKNEAFSEDGFIRVLRKNEALELIPALTSGIDLYNRVMQNKPAYLAEALFVLPYPRETLDILDAYNSLGKVRDLKGRLYKSHTRRAEVPLFEEATRLESPRRTIPIPDPQPARELPPSETVYILLKDTNFGDTFYRGELSTSPHGLDYNLTNFKGLRFLFFTVLKEENLSVNMYMEPLAEGMLLYIVGGAEVSDFIAKRINISSAIAKRTVVFVDWVREGLKTVR